MTCSDNDFALSGADLGWKWNSGFLVACNSIVSLACFFLKISSDNDTHPCRWPLLPPKILAGLYRQDPPHSTSNITMLVSHQRCEREVFSYLYGQLRETKMLVKFVLLLSFRQLLVMIYKIAFVSLHWIKKKSRMTRLDANVVETPPYVFSWLGVTHNTVTFLLKKQMFSSAFLIILHVDSWLP